MEKMDKLFSLSRALVLSTIEHYNSNPEHIRDSKQINISEIIEITKLTRTSVYNHLKQLEDRGLITHEKKKDETGQPVIYYLTTPKADSVPFELLMKFKELFSTLFKDNPSK